MNGYSKIRLVGGSNKSKSIDFSDLYSPPKTPKSVTPASKQAPTHDSRGAHDLVSVEEESGVVGERFGVILRRNCSVSAVSSKRFTTIESNNNIENNNNKQRSVVIQSAVKRAFSMRRSSSVSEGYCRIYDQTVRTSPTNDHDVVVDHDEGHDDDLMNMHARSDVKKTKRGRKILRACKRLFGFTK